MRARRRLGPNGVPLLSRATLFTISNLAYVCAAAVFPAHLLFAVEEHSAVVRLLTAVPAAVLLLEARRFLQQEAGELPFLVLALLQYYVVFAFGIFFDLKFFDLYGPVSFSQSARTSGALAVALGSVAIWVGARLGRRVGNDLQPFFIKAMPSTDVPEQWDKALYLYAGATMFVSLALVFFPGIVPASFSLVMVYAFPLELAIGFALVLPPRNLGPRAAQMLLAFAAGLGMLRGVLEIVFRGAIAYLAGRWAVVRTISFRVALVILALYVIVQPVKAAFRQQVWVAGRPAAGVTERVDAWNNAFSGYLGDGNASPSDEGGMARLSELGAVMHAFDVVPARVSHLDGAGFLPVLYAPIPRVLWPGKPTTSETVQRYAFIFGRQTERGARTTAINLPLLVEGYWNFGWIGVAFVCSALGLWLGLSQRLFSGEHWAMRATGIANVANISVAGPVVYAYSSLFQTVTGRLAVCWGVFWLASQLSRRRYEGAQRPAGRQPLRR